MLWKLGKLFIGWGEVKQVGRITVHEKEETITVRTPRIIDQKVEMVNEVPVFVDIVVELPRYSLRTVDKEIAVPKYNIVDQPREIAIDRPVVVETSREIEVQHLVYKDTPVEVPRYMLEQKKIVPDTVVQIECVCGNKYPASYTKCTKCGRKTSELYRGE